MNKSEMSLFLKRVLSRFTIMIVLIIMLNFCLFMGLLYHRIWEFRKDNIPRETLKAVTNDLKYTNGSYQLSPIQAESLSEKGIWAMLLSPKGEIVWSEKLPHSIPRSYSLNDVALFSHGYLHDYPVFVWHYDENHLLVLGYPKSSFIKLTNNYAPITIIEQLPIYLILSVIFNILLLFLVCTFSYTKTQRKLAPLIEGITKLSKGEYIKLPTAGDFIELSGSLNRTSDILEQKELARSTWISGISHDIRTPLSLILGYSDRLVTCAKNKGVIQKQALIIRGQCIRIKELIEDLNLFTNLEYSMQPMRNDQIFFKKLVRTIVIDFLNTVQTDKYDIILQCTLPDTICICGDEHLLDRAIRNVIQNSINHNPDGCTIKVKLSLEERTNQILLMIEDNGVGISQAKLQSLLNSNEYQYKGQNLTESPHGLGLTLVKLIVETHGGEFSISSDGQNGVCCIAKLKIDTCKSETATRFQI